MLRCFAVLLFSASLLGAREFSVVTYNVENLFDADGVAAYDDYQPATYTPAHVATKIATIAEVLAKVNGGQGPDIICFEEIENDQTPLPASPLLESWLASVRSTTAQVLLTSGSLSADLANLPAEYWLAKALIDAGLPPYTVIAGNDKASLHEDGHPRSIKTVIFTRFPVKAVRTHPTHNARNILEVTVDVDGYPLTIFNNHWKSGAGSPATEETRRQNAGVLRARVDALLAADANTDIIIAGDLNSHYNQKRRYPQMGTTGINDVLGVSGDEMGVRRTGPGLYNLWFELPADQRGSDTYRGEWGTLMHLIISRGLYDNRGVTYVDNSFVVLKVPELNADSFGMPIRWLGSAPAGRGGSDHFPLLAWFTTVRDGRTDRWIQLTNPSVDDDEGDALPTTVSRERVAAMALELDALPANADLRSPDYYGKIFAVNAPTGGGKYLSVLVRGQTYDIYCPDRTARDRLEKQKTSNRRLKFYGQLGTYKGNWQFVVQSAEWVR